MNIPTKYLVIIVIVVYILSINIAPIYNPTVKKDQTISLIKAPEHDIGMCEKSVSMIETHRRSSDISGDAGMIRLFLYEGGKFSLDYDNKYKPRMRNRSIEEAQSNLKEIIKKLKIASKYCDMIIEDGQYSDQDRLTIKQYESIQKQTISKVARIRKANKLKAKRKKEQDLENTIRYNKDLEEMK